MNAQGTATHNNKAVEVITPTDDILVFDSIKQAAAAIPIHSQSLANLLHNRRPVVKGFKARFL